VVVEGYRYQGSLMDVVNLDSENCCDEVLNVVMGSCNEGLED
jgi:hypothetical protein